MSAPAAAPPAEACQVVELRQYTLKPGTRDALVALFDREFVEPQEAVGMRVIGQFRDLDDADRFVWLRGFADMASRAAGLQAFYGGPTWLAHREAANATMVDSDDVLLLRPAWPGASFIGAARPTSGEARVARGVLLAWVYALQAPADAALLDACRQRVAPWLDEAGARRQAWYVTEPAPNDFPRLPVREGEHVLACFALFDDAETAFAIDGACRERLDAALSGSGARRLQRLALAPTARSALRAQEPARPRLASTRAQ